ncbi:MAG: carboxypeptidase regulatory-like domain-containing protein, partial [Vicinamibacterales bacterium]
MRRFVLAVLIFVTGLHTAAWAQTAPTQILAGTVVDTSGGLVAGATVTFRQSGLERTTVTDGQGAFTLDRLPPGPGVVTVRFAGFDETSQSAAAGDSLRLVIRPLGVSETVNVAGVESTTRRVTSATKTDTPLRDIPQAVSVVSQQLIADQRMQSMSDVVRYMPGVGMAQGEGNRDTPVLRGNSTTS